MIYITGDCHANFHKMSMAAFPEQKEMTKDDYLIVCGDFGGVWDQEKESPFEQWWLDWMEVRNYSILFVDGNHENFERLYSYPEKEWKGGRVHEIRPHVLHLMRGHVFDIDGMSFFTFGGARSHDIQGGVFEPDDPELKRKSRYCEEFGTPYRINHRSWWKEEMPNAQEMGRGAMNLDLCGRKVDFIVTHDCPASTLALFSHGAYKPDELNRYLEEIRSGTEYRRWFFGHYHDDRQVNDRDIMLYNQIIRII